MQGQAQGVLLPVTDCITAVSWCRISLVPGYGVMTSLTELLLSLGMACFFSKEFKFMAVALVCQ